jgi:glyoxylase-like metal-dependent hydrolase (beta-lactamase superfamily II)
MQSFAHVRPTPRFEAVAPGVHRFRDACNVYALGAGRDAVLVDAGSGDVLEALPELGIERVTDVVVTHHHRDVAQGLGRLAEAGARVWVPPLERWLLEGASAHWQERPLDNDYDLRQDRFSPLASVPVAGVVDEYKARAYGAFELFALPTPGHTAGSVTYLLELDGRRLAFCGDLVHAGGKVPSLAATQWSYSGAEGLAATHVSCAVLAGRRPGLLLPAHGPVIEEPELELAAVRERVGALFRLRLEAPWDLDDLVAQPWAEVAPGFLRNRASFANQYALLSETGGALLVDAGYDITTGLVPSTRREAKRALLWPLDALRAQYGVERIEAAIPTHFHDDHVVGLELVRAVEGTEVWAPENVAPILLEPRRYDLPCLPFEPIPVDRVLTLGEPLSWHEHELHLHPLPGHTLFAAAIELEVGGVRVLAVGDQQTGGECPILNYQYRNRFRPDDFVASAELYRRVRPDVLVSGHWPPQRVSDALLDRLSVDAARLVELHAELLPEEAGVGLRIEPYRSEARVGEPVELDVVVRNPFGRAVEAELVLALSERWPLPPPQRLALAAGAEGTARFALVPGGPGRRVRVGADLSLDGIRFGQLAEALVDVR